MKQLFAIIVFLNLVVAYSQVKSHTFDGYYNGINLNVQCRESVTTPYTYCDCIDSIAVNGKVIPDLLYDRYQLDISNKLDLQLHDEISITFYYERCDFRMINVSDFLPKEILPVTDLKIDDGLMSWTTQQNYPQLKLWVQVEQYKWDRWVKIDENINIVDTPFYSMDISKYLNDGENKFRATVATIDQHRSPSAEIIVPHEAKKVKCKVNTKKKYIKFSRSTHFELYDASWAVAKRGVAESIDIQKLKPGNYVIKYSNLELGFTIK